MAEELLPPYIPAKWIQSLPSATPITSKATADSSSSNAASLATASDASLSTTSDASPPESFVTAASAVDSSSPVSPSASSAETEMETDEKAKTSPSSLSQSQPSQQQLLSPRVTLTSAIPLVNRYCAKVGRYDVRALTCSF